MGKKNTIILSKSCFILFFKKNNLIFFNHSLERIFRQPLDQNIQLFDQEIQIRRYLCQEQDYLIQELDNMLKIQKEKVNFLTAMIKQRNVNKLIIKQQQIDSVLQCMDRRIISSAKRLNKIKIRIKALKYVIKIIKNKH